MNLSIIKGRFLIDTRYLAIIVTVVLSISFSDTTFASSNEVQLELSPKQCVAIHQGQKCFVDVEINWRTLIQGEYCLFSSQQAKALKCWQHAKQGKFVQEIVAKENISFMLKEGGSAVVLSSNELEMAWVFKKSTRARSSWRMF